MLFGDKPKKNPQSKPKITGKKKVKELKLVIMSATLDPTKFKTFFGT